MLKYVRFLIWLIHKRFLFFRYPKSKKAFILEKKHLYFYAGLIYYRLKNYQKATSCFSKTHAYKYLMKSYEKLGLISEALLIADEHHYYKEGALLCLKTENFIKAAYFYSYFDSLRAAKLYKKEKHFFEAGLCYLQKFQFTYAMDCFYKCPNPLHRLEGFKQVEELAIVFYLDKQYEESFKLFIRLKDYSSALECAKKLGYTTIIEDTLTLIHNSQVSALTPTDLPPKSPNYPSLSENLRNLSA